MAALSLSLSLFLSLDCRAYRKYGLKEYELMALLGFTGFQSGSIVG